MSKEEKKAVDFADPASIEAELAAVGTDAAAAVAKEKKPPKPKIIKVSFIADKDYATGETSEFDYELPKSTATRGIVAGIPLEEMSEDELKIEYRNANSVYYKTKKKGGDTTKSGARLEAVRAEMDKKGIAPTSRASTEINASVVANLIKDGKISVEDIQKLLEAAGE